MTHFFRITDSLVSILATPICVTGRRRQQTDRGTWAKSTVIDRRRRGRVIAESVFAESVYIADKARYCLHRFADNSSECVITAVSVFACYKVGVRSRCYISLTDELRFTSCGRQLRIDNDDLSFSPSCLVAVLIAVYQSTMFWLFVSSLRRASAVCRLSTLPSGILLLG